MWHLECPTADDLSDYMESDPVSDWLNTSGDSLICQRWLRETPAKRMIFNRLYGDLIGGSGRSVLDIGGGLTSITTILARAHNYVLVDILAHGGQSAGVITQDWFSFGPAQHFDVVIANDLFPNVDQRLALFLRTAMKWGDELRLSLTYFHEPRFHMTKRIGAEEQLCMLQWDSQQLASTLVRFGVTGLDVLHENRKSLFPNGRQIAILMGSS